MLRLGLIDELEIFRASLKVYLESTGIYEVTIHASNGLLFYDALEQADIKPDIVLTEFHMPGMGGLELSKKIKLKYPQIKVIMLTAFSHHHIISRVFKNGADGIIVKSSSLETFNAAIDNVRHNNKVIVDKNSDMFILPSLPNWHSKFEGPVLSEKQVNFITLCAVSEYTYKSIADKMHISVKTVDRYRDELFKKLNIKSRTGLVIYAIQNGLFNPLHLSSATQS